ncbi:MAG: glycoside hydrolase family 16 protein [Clostridiales bacterium]|nr:glycoside hydrolase family 16 protein [Clostridiales bacterium]
MRKIIVSFIALILCFSVICTTPAAAVRDPSPREDGFTLELSEDAQTSFDKFINKLIDVVHRFIVIFRIPWNSSKKKTVDMSKFTLTFSDEFNGDKLDRSVWDSHSNVRKGGYWHSSQAFVRDGNLVIRTEYKQNGAFGPGYYTGNVHTKYTFMQKYGYFECRCILPAAEGIWSAFWLFSPTIMDYVPGKQGTEIDIFESPMWYRGNRGLENGLVTSNLHYGGYDLGHRYKNVTVAKANNPYKEYNTYGMEWNEKGYTFYVNGQKTGFSRFGGVSEVPEYVKLTVEVDGVDGKPYTGWSGLITANDPGAIPAEFLVDYVRVYQYNDILDNQ